MLIQNHPLRMHKQKKKKAQFDKNDAKSKNEQRPNYQLLTNPYVIINGIENYIGPFGYQNLKSHERGKLFSVYNNLWNHNFVDICDILVPENVRQLMELEKCYQLLNIEMKTSKANYRKNCACYVKQRDTTVTRCRVTGELVDNSVVSCPMCIGISNYNDKSMNSNINILMNIV